MNLKNITSKTPRINLIDYKGYQLGILRLDELHPDVSGNKWYKLNYNLQQAITENKNTILTFGGAYSNHIAATAAACQLTGYKSIGIIRGEITSESNSTLSLAKQRGMQLKFLNRDLYRKKNDALFLQNLQKEFPQAYIIPEGGDNELGEKGCQEILGEETKNYQSVFCAYGTGTTFKGMAKSLLPAQNLIGINVLKYEAFSNEKNTNINNDYHCGGYAKHTSQLLEFKSWFETTYHIPLDYVYTAKLFFAVFDLINQQQLPKNEKTLVIHSGGLQGNSGYEERYGI